MTTPLSRSCSISEFEPSAVEKTDQAGGLDGRGHVRPGCSVFESLPGQTGRDSLYTYAIMTRLSDVQLIEAAKNGSQEAVAVLYERHLPFLLAQSRTYAGADLEPHDLVHEAWIRMLGDLHRFTPRKSFRSWAVTVLRNLGRDEASRRSRRKELLFQHRVDLSGTSCDDREKHAQRVRARQVKQLMEPLTARQRLALLLHVGQQTSSGEVSRAMGCAPPTVRTTCFFALERIRSELRYMGRRAAG